MNTLIFDLDGTLIHTAKLVLPAFHRAIRCFPQYPLPSERMMLGTFGMPDDEIWETLMPTATPDERAAAHRLCDEFIREDLFRHDVLLPDARDVLTALRDRGHTLTIASNCGVAYLDAVLDSQGIRPLFDRPLCLQSVNGRRKADILTAHFQHFPRMSAVMIGDRKTDIEAAQAHGIPAIGCDFHAGFGENHELAGAAHIIQSLGELLDMY